MKAVIYPQLGKIPITVLENMLAREGLSRDTVHRTVQQEKQEDKEEPSDGGIQLEL